MWNSTTGQTHPGGMSEFMIQQMLISAECAPDLGLLPTPTLLSRWHVPAIEAPRGRGTHTALERPYRGRGVTPNPGSATCWPRDSRQ